jgi:hypothetical protein
VRRPPIDAALASPWHREGEVAGWLSRSTWSLALIALWRKSRDPASQVTVWVPDFFCNAALSALRQTGANLLFYPLTAELAPDLVACRMLADDNSPDLFLLVHYFGKPCASGPARDFCAEQGTWLIEDAAHVLRPADAIGVCGDFSIYSPHKYLAIPDGAVLVARPDGPSRLGAAALSSFGEPAGWPGQLHDLQRQMGDTVASSRVQALVWLIKRILQKLGVRSLPSAATPYDEPLTEIEPARTKLPAPSQSKLSRSLLAGIPPPLGEIADRRQEHQLLWDSVLANDEGRHNYGVSVAERPANREWLPYLAAYRIDSDKLRATYDRWHRLGLPVSTWPDLPPEVTANPERHVRALSLRDTHLYLSVHQSLGAGSILKQCGPLRAMTEDGRNSRR